MPTCSIEDVHPSIFSLVGGIHVAESKLQKLLKSLLEKPSLSERISHIDLENLDFNSIRTFQVEECPICGTDKLDTVVKEELIIEELCGRNKGKRTYSITPTGIFDLNVDIVTSIAKQRGFVVENQNDLGLSMRTNELSVSFMKKGSAVVVGAKDESDAVSLHKNLLGKEITA